MIKFNMRGQDKTEAFLKDLPYGAKKIALPEISKYLVGDERHGLKWYPAQTTQVYERTYELRNSWEIQGDLYRQRIINTAAHAPYPPTVWKIYNWRMYADIIKSNMDGAMRSARARVGEWLRSK